MSIFDPFPLDDSAIFSLYSLPRLLRPETALLVSLALIVVILCTLTDLFVFSEFLFLGHTIHLVELIEVFAHAVPVDSVLLVETLSALGVEFFDAGLPKVLLCVAKEHKEGHKAQDYHQRY